MLILLKSVPLLISYDVICVETLHLNNFARFLPFGQFIVNRAWPQRGLHAFQICSQMLKSSQSY